jgi:hypothetical protein
VIIEIKKNQMLHSFIYCLRLSAEKIAYHSLCINKWKKGHVTLTYSVGIMADTEKC